MADDPQGQLASKANIQTRLRIAVAALWDRRGVLAMGIGSGVAATAWLHPSISTAIAGLGVPEALVLGAAGGLLLAGVGEGLLGRLARLHPTLYRRLRSTRLQIQKVQLKGLGEVVLSFGEEDRAALWPVYVELVSRISANSLKLSHGDGKQPEDTGDLALAFKSLHGIFAEVRTALAKVSPEALPLIPGQAGRRDQPVTWVLNALNLCIRPFLARWHPWLDVWKETGLPEQRWPGVKDCREDLEDVRKVVAAIVAELASIYGHGAPGILRPSLIATWHGSPDRRPWAWGAEAGKAMTLIWRAARARVPGVAVEADRHALRAVLLSWRALADQMDAALLTLSPIPKVELGEDEVRPDTELLGWRMALEPVLLAWEARSAAWSEGTTAAELERCAVQVDAARLQLVALLAASQTPH